MKSEMEHRIRQRTRQEGSQLTYGYRDQEIRSCYQFDEWRKYAGWSNRQVRENNQDIIRFAELVGGRRAAYSRLTGADFLRDESGEYCVRFLHDKGGKTQYQRVAPEHVQEVAAYFAGKQANELIFPEKMDKNLDLHAIRAQHARVEYKRYAAICSTPEGRNRMREQLLARFYDPVIGNKAWLSAKSKGDITRMKKREGI